MTLHKKGVLLRQIKDFFDLEQLSGDEHSLDRYIYVPDVNRPGLELAGIESPNQPHRIIIIGNKESNYIHNYMSEEQQKERFARMINHSDPVIVMTDGIEAPCILLEIASMINYPVLRTASPTTRFTVDLISYLDEVLAEETTVSGVLMDVYGKGVLITGHSGIGKSEAALELMRDGHALIADDRVDIQRYHNHLVGFSPEILTGLLEIRGIGIIDARRMFGDSSFKARSNIDFVIRLVGGQQEDEGIVRIGDEYEQTTSILGVKLPLIVLPVMSGRSTYVLIETAVANYMSKEQGNDSAKLFRRNLSSLLQKNNQEVTRRRQEQTAVLFDLDGTLADTEPAIIHSYEQVFRTYGSVEDFTPERRIEVLGPSLDEEMHKFFPSVPVPEMIDLYKNYQTEHLAEWIKPMPNAEKTLKEIRDLGYKTGIVTTRRHDSVLNVLEILGLKDYFDIIIGHDDVERGKPDPEGILKAVDQLGCRQSVYVGDSAGDMRAGRAAGSLTVAYPTKEEKRTSLEKAAPDYIINDLHDLMEILHK
ncbi:MAG: HPr(Ser) kinase/phosphatase [Solobacterium sp.]|nr:HPr(Ser) kinase/phosphatase [Solobacterium sp.]